MKMFSLLIFDLGLLTVTKIDDNRVFFKYDGNCYMVDVFHEGDVDLVSLYRCFKDKNGRWKRQTIGHATSSLEVPHLINGTDDKEHFVRMLTKLGLVTGIYEQEYIDIVNARNEMEEKNLRDDHWFPVQTADQFEA